MAISVETRIPFIDHKLIEYIYSLPVKYFFNNYNKFFLRNALKNDIPKYVNKNKIKIQRPSSDKRLVFEKLAEVPHKLYGNTINSNYQNQGLALSKHFRVLD